jgi:hypothetical protein
MYGGLAVIVGIIAILDWFGRRKDRRAHERTA